MERVKAICALVLVITSVGLAWYQAISIEDIANGVLMYIAQAFLLAAGILGLDAYLDHVRNHEIHK